ncbi:hypothetical protein RAM_10305 [Amycolatopsis mediterranei S699]|uniref:Uncharacterized protein n=1 Tax=Amycolatopsis mediterranei (strain S699) TaxID=713604 RepID=A0A9R0NTV7_AMYMS|nr:hypothetical protein RAM_10305 [Amycolatopsis mediterranei S699]
MTGIEGGEVAFEPFEVPVDDVGAARQARPGAPGDHGRLPVALKNA